MTVLHSPPTGTSRLGGRTLVVARCSVASATEPPSPRWQTVAVVPYWNLPSGAQNVEKNRNSLTMVSPWLYGVNDTGDIVRAKLAPEADAVLPRLRTSGLAVVPTVSNASGGAWQYEPIAAMLHDPERMHGHVSELVNLALEEGFDGLGIDYEELRARDRDVFSAFIATLAQALHAEGRILSVDVFAKASDEGYDERNLAQDYAAIGRAADQVRLMAYDFHWSTSKPGPVASYPWVRDVLAYARQQVPQGRLLLGLPLYGYDWSTGCGRELSWTETQELARRPDSVRMWDDARSANRLTYVDGGVLHEVWYEDGRSIAAKVDLARRYAVSGVFLWMYGPEDPRVWGPLAGLAGTPVARCEGSSQR